MRVNIKLLSAILPCLVMAAPVISNELCPVASDRLNRSVSFRNTVITAPQTAEDTRALLALLQDAEGEPRTIAIMRLAMAGDLEAFRLLLRKADANGLFVYAGRYLNRDDTVCVDPELERAILDKLDDPILGRSLVGLFGYNNYRDIRMFHALREILFDLSPAETDKFMAFGRAITSTHLPEIEADVLAHARRLLPFDTPLKKRVLPGLHQHYVKFFSERGYEPAVAYFREVLIQANRLEPIQSFQINYGMLRVVIQRALATIGGTDANSVLIGELEEIADQPLDPFAASELQILGKALLSPSQPKELRATVSALERILKTPQPGQYDYPMRRTVYQTLAVLNTSEATALLVAELKRYMGNEPPPNRNAAVVRLFEALGTVQDLDVEQLLALAGRATSPADRRSFWNIIAAHPSEITVDYFLGELLSATSDEQEQQPGADATRVLLNILVSFELAGLQNRARNGIDNLFDERKLGEADYVFAATRLNEALGNESPLYLALREQQAVERQTKRTEAEAEGKQKIRLEFAAELSRQSSAEGIAANIDLLNSGGRGGRAVDWLIIVGEAALPQLHAALASVDTSERQRFQIVSVLGEIGSVESTALLIESAETRGDGKFYTPVLFALALISPTDESIAFALAQLAVGIPERRQIAGLVYLARVRHVPSSELVERFTDRALSSGLRSVGWYLGARLEVRGTSVAIEAEMQQATERSSLETLLTALGESADSTAEFTRVANAAGFTQSSVSYRRGLAYCAFRTSPDVGKVELAYEVLRNGDLWQRREVIRYLIETDPQGTVNQLTGGMGMYLPLDKLLPLSSATQLLFSESRRMGYQLEQTDAGYVPTKIE